MKQLMQDQQAMDPRPFFRGNVNSNSPLSSQSSSPNKLCESVRFDVKKYVHFDGDQHSSDNSSSYNSSSFETNRSSPSAETSFPQNDTNLLHLDYALWDLEHVLMSPDSDGHALTNTSSVRVPCFKNLTLRQVLTACAEALYDGRMEEFEEWTKKARGLVSISGDPIQRVGAYMIEGLVARKESSGKNICKALRCREPESHDMLSYMQILYEICPYLKFGYMAANGAIADACRNEDRIHIVDFQIAQGAQWFTLLQALAGRPGGPPRVRITGIDDPISNFARGAGLELVGKRLGMVSEKFKIDLEFHGVPVFAPDVTREMLGLVSGEALVVNFPLQLHHIPDESVDVSNPRDGLLRMVKSLSPKVVTLVEQESNTNTTPFLTRFEETLDFYLAMFDSIDVSLPRDQKQRIGVEQHCLARDMVNIIACEGKDREERHELFGKWKSRFTMAGFRQYPLSSYVNSVIGSLLKCYSENYSLVERDGGLLLGWKNRNLVSASAWH